MKRSGKRLIKDELIQSERQDRHSRLDNFDHLFAALARKATMSRWCNEGRGDRGHERIVKGLSQ